ncbi:DUF6029 family protein [Flavobacterium sp. 3HN19-14]|uniref:DUF6029 family protein n=1 Tax=Flavobacterium sp. 3HN19-14 TaxID=3448133 RepID=UPI003EDF7FCC
MKKLLSGLVILASVQLYAQEEPKDKGSFYGGFESNAQWYLNDKDLGIEHPERAGSRQQLPPSELQIQKLDSRNSG